MSALLYKRFDALNELLWQLFLWHMSAVFVLNQLSIWNEASQASAVGNRNQAVTSAMQNEDLH